MPHSDSPKWDSPLDNRICYILDRMKELNLDLTSFFDAIMYGDERCTSNAQIRQCRSLLLNSSVFGEILFHCYHRPVKSDGSLRKGSQAISNFAGMCIQNVWNDELESLVDDFSSDDLVCEAALLETNFENLKSICAIKSPLLYGTLMAICTTSRQQKRNKKKLVADKIIVLIISMILYQWSARNNVVQKLLSVYWVACGVSSRACRVLHALGLAMSPTWTQDAIGLLTKGALARVRSWVAINPFAVIHDNINIAYKVSSQRIDHCNHFDNGAARSVDRWEHVSEKKTLDWDQIFEAVQLSEEKMQLFSIYHVIQFLLQHPSFALWQERFPNFELLGFPGDLDPLPVGAAHRTQHWPLRTVLIDESTLEGTASVVEEVWRQCHFSNPIGRKSLAIERLIPWIGDQKSVSLLRGIQGLRGCDLNGFQRMDYVFPLKGWFHEVMALQNQIHQKHLGTNSSTGLARDITRLSRIGLKPQLKKTKPDFHDLHELIAFVLQARILDCWLVQTGCSTLTELAAQPLNALDIETLAGRIVDSFTSADAIRDMRKKLEIYYSRSKPDLTDAPTK